VENDHPLIELKNITQTEAGIFRRIFIDDDNDLTVWYDLERRLIGFQLSIYDIAITYDKNKLKIQKIDFCEKDNLAPILKETTVIDFAKVIDYLERNNQNIDQPLMDYIFKALAEGRTGLGR